MKVGWVEIVSAAAMATYYLVVQHSQIAPVRLSFQWRALRRLLGEGLSLGLGQVVWALNQYLSTLLVAVFLGSEQIAYFGAAGRIVLSLGTFMHLYHFNLFPAVSKSLHASTGSFLELTRPSLRITSWLGIGVALPASFVATPLCQLAFGEAFGAAGPALAIVVWTLPTILVAGHARFALIASGHQRYVLASQLAGVVATLVLGLLLIPPLGPVGAGVAMLASFLAVWLASAWFTSRAVVRIPFTAYLSRPCAAAVAAAGAVRCLGLTGWWAGLCAGVVYFAAAALLDRAIFRDARQLAESKGTQPDQP
jgi:O-antigen/teichoic acid export membrane protein